LEKSSPSVFKTESTTLPPKYWCQSTTIYSVTSRKTVLTVVASVAASNITSHVDLPDGLKAQHESLTQRSRKLDPDGFGGGGRAIIIIIIPFYVMYCITLLVSIHI
jgi:hypothetical protein